MVVTPPEGQQSLEPPSQPPLSTWITAPSGRVIVVSPPSSMVRMLVLPLLELLCPLTWNSLPTEPQAVTAPTPNSTAPLATTIDDRVRPRRWAEEAAMPAGC
jgi:hypothetical protein